MTSTDRAFKWRQRATSDARARNAVTSAKIIFRGYCLLECLSVLAGRIGAADV
jgi:hypothetical protein